MKKNRLPLVLSLVVIVTMILGTTGVLAQDDTTAPVTNAVTPLDQPISAANTVVVPLVTADVDGWLVIHADNNGAPGPVIGNAPVSAGDNINVVVQVDPAGVTPVLYAMLHIDAGELGVYEFPGPDGPATDADGNVVTPPFNVLPFVGAPPIGNSVTVADQNLAAGNTVTIERVVADVDGWLVVHADNAGTPGPVIGHAPVEQGTNFNVVVPVDPTRATGTLYAMLHVDRGFAGIYEFPGPDGPARDAAGNVVTPPFAFRANVVVPKDQLIMEDNIVTVPRVLSLQQGWIVIHADNEGAPGPVIGQAAVASGENNNVNVVVDPAGVTGTLYAMLHVDEGEPFVYEFPGSDVPARDLDGNVVTPPFSVEANAVFIDDQFLGLDSTVVADKVYAAVDGWLVIHADNNGAPGSVIGWAPVYAGVNEFVTVNINTNRATSVLYAMLHVDEGIPGVYEFPGPDGPAVDIAGNVVTPPFDLIGF